VSGADYRDWQQSANYWAKSRMPTYIFLNLNYPLSSLLKKLKGYYDDQAD